MKLYKILMATAMALTFQLTSANTQPNTNMVLFSSAGSSTHTYAMRITPALSETLNSNFVIEFKPGAEGLIGALYLDTFNNKNTTVLMFGNALLDWSSLPNNRGINQLDSFEIVAYTGYLPMYVLASGNSNFTNLMDIIEKSKTQRVSYGVSRNNPIRKAVYDLLVKYGNPNNIQEITYRSGSAAAIDVVNGNLDFVLAQPHQFKSMFDAGKLRYISSLNRPVWEFPTQSLEQQGLENIELQHFPHYFIWANKGADPSFLARIRDVVNKLVLSGELSEFVVDSTLIKDPTKTMNMLFRK